MNQSPGLDSERFLSERALLNSAGASAHSALLDDGTYRELVGRLIVSNRRGCQAKALFRRRTMD